MRYTSIVSNCPADLVHFWKNTSFPESIISHGVNMLELCAQLYVID